jgi:hypothetical protein
MKKTFQALANKAVGHPVSLFPPNDRAYNYFGELVVAKCLKIIENSESLDEASRRIKEKFEQKT